jgi:amino acid transporter
VQVFGVSILLLLTAVNWSGLRAGSQTQKVASVLKALALLGFVAAAFLFGGTASLPIRRRRRPRHLGARLRWSSPACCHFSSC